jgi:putative transposase
MARPLRIQRAGGRYQVTARGNERRTIFRDDRDRRHFLGLLGELPERFGIRVHGWVLMDNHSHLLWETPEPNLSLTGQWLNRWQMDRDKAWRRRIEAMNAELSKMKM